MKKLILIIAALMLISCTSTEPRESSIYNDDVTILNSNGDVIKEYNNVDAFTLNNAEGVYIRTSDGERFYILGGIIIVKDM